MCRDQKHMKIEKPGVGRPLLAPAITTKIVYDLHYHVEFKCLVGGHTMLCCWADRNISGPNVMLQDLHCFIPQAKRLLQPSLRGSWSLWLPCCRLHLVACSTIVLPAIYSYSIMLPAMQYYTVTFVECTASYKLVSILF